MYNIKKVLIMFAFALVACGAFSLATPEMAQATDLDLGFDYADNLGLSNSEVTDPREMAVNIVRFFMTFLGIIAVVIILLGGFKWMTAAGNEDKVAEAKKLLVAGIIGLAIIISAYVIVNFVLTTTDSIIQNGDIQY